MSDYTDLVVWTNDVPGLVDEALALGYESWLRQDEDGTYTLGGDRTPLVVKWPDAIALIRVSDVAALGSFTKLQVLGWYDGDTFVASGEVAQAKYNSLYPRTPYYDSLSGETRIPPSRIGSFG